MATFVLVHGAWAWRLVLQAGPLRATNRGDDSLRSGRTCRAQSRYCRHGLMWRGTSSRRVTAAARYRATPGTCRHHRRRRRPA
jgi:hypothetical protein